MKTIAANLKANHTQRSFQTYCNILQSELDTIQHTKNNEIIVFPNQASLSDNTHRHFELGAQNAYPIYNGAFTGEIGLEILESLAIKHIMIGHSERRTLLHEDNAIILQKYQFFMQANMRIMLCVGEDSSIKDIANYLALQLEHIDLDYPLLTIAYEPIWAIGSGRTPSIEDIQKVMEILQKLGVKKSLYGGSVNKENIAQICKYTDGVLIGSASLDAYNFAQMIANIN